MRTAEPKWHRRDITGLRAFAIIPVVAFHAGATFLPGGFVGVDIFFAISGFLITSLLLREVGRSGRIRTVDFWAKRLRRLAPALLLTVIVTLPMAALVSTVLAWDQLAAQAVASGLYVANIFFWFNSDSYFDTGSATSPFLHMWSLGVEEQFYLIWPFLIIAASLVARRRSLRLRLAVTFGIVFIASLVLSVWLSPRDPNAAFYLLPTRAWEFAGAGLLALLPLERMVRGRAVPTVLAAVGAMAILGSVVLFTEELRYPGAWAAVPVGGTLLILIAGAGPSRHHLAGLFENRVSVWLGNVSYSWYLWHWPLAVFAAALFPSDWVMIALSAVVSLGLGALSYYFVETPLRFAPSLVSSNRRTYFAALSATVVVIVVAGGTYLAGAAILRSEPYREYASAAQTLPSTACDSAEETAGGLVCVDGDPHGRVTIALIGDSHAGHWRHEFAHVAEDMGIRLLVRWRSGCPSLQVNMIGSSGAINEECIEFRDGTLDAMEELRPDAVVISNAAGYIETIRGDEYEDLTHTESTKFWGDALRAQIDRLQSAGATVAVIDDNPRMQYNPTECLTRLGATPGNCASSRNDSMILVKDLAAVTREVSNDAGLVAPLSVTDAICSATSCAAATATGIPVYQDQTHLSRAWTATQRSAVESFFARLTERVEAGADANLLAGG